MPPHGGSTPLRPDSMAAHGDGMAVYGRSSPLNRHRPPAQARSLQADDELSTSGRTRAEQRRAFSIGPRTLFTGPMTPTIAPPAEAPAVSPTLPAETPAGRPSPVTLTDRALTEVRRIVANKQIPAHFGLRVGVKGGGCSGMSYVLGFDKAREHDLTFEIAADGDPVTVFMDKRHGLYLLDTTVDYHDGLDARGFVFDNPTATSTCGCGSSFSA